MVGKSDQVSKPIAVEGGDPIMGIMAFSRKSIWHAFLTLMILVLGVFLAHGRDEVQGDSPPQVMVARLLEKVQVNGGGVFSIVDNENTKIHLAPSFWELLNALRQSRICLSEAIRSVEKYDLTSWGRDVLESADNLYLWSPRYQKPSYVRVLGQSLNMEKGIGVVRVFIGDLVEDEGKGTGPYASLAIFEFKYKDDVWVIKDIQVDRISDRLSQYRVTDKLKEDIARIREIIKEIRNFEHTLKR